MIIDVKHNDSGILGSESWGSSLDTMEDLWELPDFHLGIIVGDINM